MGAGECFCLLVIFNQKLNCGAFYCTRLKIDQVVASGVNNVVLHPMNNTISMLLNLVEPSILLQLVDMIFNKLQQY